MTTKITKQTEVWATKNIALIQAKAWATEIQECQKFKRTKKEGLKQLIYYSLGVAAQRLVAGELESRPPVTTPVITS